MPSIGGQVRRNENRLEDNLLEKYNASPVTSTTTRVFDVSENDLIMIHSD